MYILAIIIILATMFISSGGTQLFVFLDLPSLIVVFTLSLSLLFVSGLWRDFRRALKISVSKDNFYNIHELKRAELSVRLTQRLLFASGAFASLLGLIAMFALLDDTASFLPAVSVALLTLFYSLIFILLLFPINYRIKAIILDKENLDLED